MKKIKTATIISLVCSLMWAASAHAAQPIRYVILVDNDSKNAGEQVVTESADGWTKVHYLMKDNGRGPELDERFHVNAAGILDEYHIVGTSTYGNPVDEHFLRKGDMAEWHSSSEKGSRKLGGPAFYLPMSSTPEFISVTAKAIDQAGGKLPLLPSGALTQRKLDEAIVTHAGRSQKIELFALTGVGFAPELLWKTSGPAARLFAVLEPGSMTTIEAGWESSSAVLAKRQKIAEAQLLKEMAANLQHPMPGLTVIRNARIFDSEKAALGSAADVYVLRGKITAVLPAGSSSLGADNEIDAGGRVLLPGLFDMHGHVNRWEGALHLAAGVTTVRDMGNDNAQLQQMIDESATGQLLQPQLVPAGFLEGISPFQAANGFHIKDLPGATAAVDWYAEHGYPQLKIYNSFPHELLRDTVAYAHSRGMRVSGHVPAFMRAQDVVEQGYDEIQHINQVLLNFLMEPTTDTRTLARFYLPAEKLATLDFDSTPVQDFIRLLKEHHTVIDPTLATFAMIGQRDGELNPPFVAIAEHMPADVQRSFRVGSMNIPDDVTARRYQASYAKMVDFVGRMYRAGIPLVAGTDDLAGFTLHSELALYVKAGLSPAQALQVATQNGARYTRTSNERGSIVAGKLADLVLVDGDPTKDIEDLRKVVLVISRGRLIYPREVDQALGIEPFVHQAPVLQALANPAVSGGGAVRGRAHLFGAAGLNQRD